jgi:hypothetical protein
MKKLFIKIAILILIKSVGFGQTATDTIPKSKPTYLSKFRDTLVALKTARIDFVKADTNLGHIFYPEYYSICDKNGKMCKDCQVVSSYTKTEEVNLLIKNIFQPTNLKKVSVYLECTFDPHHGFFFYDKNNKIIAVLQICYECDEADIIFFPFAYVSKKQFSFVFIRNINTPVLDLQKTTKELSK